MNRRQARAARKIALRIIQERERYYRYLDYWDYMWDADWPNAFDPDTRLGGYSIAEPVHRRHRKAYPHGNPYKYPERYLGHHL